MAGWFALIQSMSCCSLITDGTRPPLVEVRLAGLGVESELSLRREIIESAPHQLPTQSWSDRPPDGTCENTYCSV